MSNYTKTTNFATKDSLPSGDPNKIVKGAEINTEFDNIATAVSTKSNSESPTFTGTVTIPTADINGGAIDGTTIGGTTAASITGTTLTANTSLNIAGDGATVTGIKDEDDMASNSATKLATQQSIKAYVDSQVTAQDLDVTTDSGTISIDLDSETLTVAGGTGLDSSATGNTVTLGIDSTVATLTGTQTLTNKTLTSPDVNTPDIDGGTIDGTVIGGTTPAAVSATTVSATGNITVGGTVDGRDVATDGAKLDNIEVNADVTDTANVTAAGALMDSEVTNLAQVKAFDSADYATAAQGSTADSALQNVVEDTTPQLGGDLGTNGNDILFADNDKANFGAGNDLQIYHDGSNSYITDTSGTGDLYIRGTNLRLTDNDGTLFLFGSNNADTRLYYSGAQKLATTTAGIDVTGTVTADGLTVDGNVGIGTSSPSFKLDVAGNARASYFALRSNESAPSESSFIYRPATGVLGFGTGTAERMRIDSSGRVGIGTSSPSHLLDAVGASNSISSIRVANSDVGVRMSAYTDAYAEIRVETNHSLLFKTNGNNERMRIDSSGNVGIGTSSPQSDGNTTNLEVSSAFGARVLIANTDTNGRKYGFYSSNSGIFGLADYTASGTPTRMVLDSSGRVGIGTSSPNAKLHVECASGSGGRVLFGGSTSSAYNTNINVTDNGMELWAQSNSRGITFSTGSTQTERMRIDSSGNLLVGKTSAVYNTAGTQLASDGQVFITGGNQYGLAVNRTTGDGDLVLFSKDGLTVGSIGTRANYIKIGNGDTNLLFNSASDAVTPEGASDNRDAGIDLGRSVSRFKDLYLSGGVYLGGTSNVNKLDDYEEGTWTPAFGGTTTNPSVTYTVAVGNYTKVGRLVTVSWRLQVSAISGGSGLAQITGLPFSQATASGNAHVQICALSSMAGPAAKNGGFVEPNTAFIYLCNDNGITFSPSTLGTGIFFATASYFTT